MPIYEYDCPDCGAMFEHLARRFDEPAPACPGCGSGRARRRISVVRMGKTEAQRAEEWRGRQEQVAGASVQEQARFLQQAGGLTEQATQGLMDPQAFQEILRERARGASDADLKALGDAVVPPGAGDIEVTEHEHVHAPHEHEHDHEHEHNHNEEEHHHAVRPAQRKHLGWA